MTLETKDLILRTVNNDDIEEVARMWEFGKGCIPLADAQAAIDNMCSNHARNNLGNIYHLCLAVFERNQDSIIGWCGLDGKTVGKLYIFFLIDADFRNRGYATQCARKLLSYAFGEVHVPYVNGGCDKENAPSFKVMTKVGMMQNAFEENGDPLFFINDEMYRKL